MVITVARSNQKVILGQSYGVKLEKGMRRYCFSAQIELLRIDLAYYVKSITFDNQRQCPPRLYLPLERFQVNFTQCGDLMSNNYLK